MVSLQEGDPIYLRALVFSEGAAGGDFAVLSIFSLLLKFMVLAVKLLLCFYLLLGVFWAGI